MKNYYIFILLIFIAIQSSFGQRRKLKTSAPIRETTLTQAQKIKQAKMDSLMYALYEKNQFNGVVMVLEKGKTIYKKAYGWENYEKKDTLQISSRFRLASVSKQFTAVAIMLLKEQGKLDYNDDITKYLPTLQYKNVTIRNLLNHNSGIPDYFGLTYSILNFFPKKRLIVNEDLLRYFSINRPKQNFRTGKKASYSNTGYVFLALIVEKASGMKFPDFLQKHIFEPTGMKETFVYNSQNYENRVVIDTVTVKVDTLVNKEDRFESNTVLSVRHLREKRLKPRAKGYMISYPNNIGLVDLDFHAFDGMYGEKSICTSVEDLAKWDRALHEDKILPKEVLKDAFKPSPVTDKKDYSYGFGWKVYNEDKNIVFHHGLYRGFRNYFQRNLGDENAMMILTNRTMGRQIVPILEALNNILYDKPYQFPKATKLEEKTYFNFKEKYFINYPKPFLYSED